MPTLEEYLHAKTFIDQASRTIDSGLPIEGFIPESWIPSLRRIFKDSGYKTLLNRTGNPSYTIQQAPPQIIVTAFKHTLRAARRTVLTYEERHSQEHITPETTQHLLPFTPSDEERNPCGCTSNPRLFFDYLGQ